MYAARCIGAHIPDVLLIDFLQISAFQQRVRDRDPCCLILGLEVKARIYTRFRETHIFPPGHESKACCIIFHLSFKLKHVMQWIEKGYPNLITDTAPLSELGGASKIDSVQNAILIRSDLHNAWSDCLIAVLPEVCIFHSSVASFLTTFWLAWIRGCPIYCRLRRCRWKDPQT
jgi:hypothetical protein